MSINPEFAEYLQDQLASFGAVAIRRMFGGAGLFRDGLMFGLVARETLYLKTADANRVDFEAAGMMRFTYQRNSKTMYLSYHEVPADVLEDADLLSEWAGKAFAVAHATKASAPPKRKRGKRQA